MLHSPSLQIDRDFISPKKTILLTWDSVSAERWAESLYLDLNVEAVNPEIFLSGQRKKRRRKEKRKKKTNPDCDSALYVQATRKQAAVSVNSLLQKYLAEDKTKSEGLKITVSCKTF